MALQKTKSNSFIVKIAIKDVLIFREAYILLKKSLNDFDKNSFTTTNKIV